MATGRPLHGRVQTWTTRAHNQPRLLLRHQTNCSRREYVCRHQVWISEGAISCLVRAVVGWKLIWLCCASYVKTEYPYTPGPSPSVAHGPGFPVNQFGSGLAAFNSQNVGCYSSSSVPMYQQHPRDVVMIAPGTTGSAHSTLSMTGIPTTYRYSLALLTAHE